MYDAGGITVGKPDITRLTAKIAATHEAGHAVVATRLGMEVGKVSITNDGHGLTEIYSDNISETDRRWAIVGCAGSVAENAFSINEGDFLGVTACGFAEKDLQELFTETKQLTDLHQCDIKKVADVLVKIRMLSGKQLRKLIKKGKLKMRNTSKIRKVKTAQKQAERSAQASIIKHNKTKKKATPALKATRVSIESAKRQKSAAEQLIKLQKQAAKVKRQAMYLKPGFVTFTKREIAELSETDRAIYMAQSTTENRKNDKKSELAKAHKTTTRKRTARRELQRSIAKAQKIVDKANKKPAEAKPTSTITISENTKKHSHKRENERRTRQAAKIAAKNNK